MSESKEARDPAEDSDSTLPSARPRVPKPHWVTSAEVKVARAIPLHPNVLTALKLLLVTPLMIAGLRQVQWLPLEAWMVMSLFLAFSALDYIDGVVARERGLDSLGNRVFDRAADLPLLLAVAYLSVDLLPPYALLAKILLDLSLIGLYLVGRGSPANNVRNAFSYAALLGLLFLSQGWAPRLLNANVVEALLWVNIAFGGLTVLIGIGLLQKRFIADAFSMANLVCGGFAMLWASRGRFEIALLFTLLGAAFDGVDGAAARRWGGTKWGVYSDDIADGVNYGIAPAVAIYFLLDRSVEGIVIGSIYASFTIGRLVYFTISKADNDPNYFGGTPSPVGGLIVMCSLVLFERQPALVGMMVGIACALMVSFATHYRHLGRSLGVLMRRRRTLIGAPIYLLLIFLGARFWGRVVPISMVLAGNLIYGFLPAALAFRLAFARRKEARESG